MNKIKPLDFTGDTIFCGLDVHKLSWRVNIRDKDMELKDFTQPPDAFTLHKHLSKNYPGAHIIRLVTKPGFAASAYSVNLPHWVSNAWY